MAPLPSQTRGKSINPFATRYVAPGKLPWIPPDSPIDPNASARHLAHLANKFAAECGGRAAVVGPHGTGKSTLLEHLVPLISPGPIHRVLLPADAPERAGPQTLWFIARANVSLPAITNYAKGDLVVVDGYEQFSWLARCRVQIGTRRAQASLLVTSHRKCGLPTLWTTNVDAYLLRKICEAAAGNAQQANPNCPTGSLLPKEIIEPEALTKIQQRFGGNTREILMHLYDLHQAASLAEKANGP